MGKTTFRDLLMLLLLGFVFMIVTMIPHINPPAKKDEAVRPPGNVVVHMIWPPGNVDVDLWLMGPGEPNPVGYTNKSGVLWNLLRDDVGTNNDLTGINFENAYTRGVPAGEYIVNVHCFRCPGPVPVTVEVRLKTKSGLKLVAVSKLTIMPNSEATAVRFLIDDKGNLVPGSVSRIDRKL